MSSSASPTLTFLGAARTVTGSRFLLESGRASVLVDCGLYQGRKDLRLKNWEPFPHDPRTIDAVVLTHAHVDHCGYLPVLARNGFGGPVIATAATTDLAGIVLPDSGRLQEEEAAYANRKGYSKHAPALPLYTEHDATVALERFEPIEFGEQRSVGDIDIRLQPAGHILGSAIVEAAIDSSTTIVWSGDLGRRVHPLLSPPASRPRADTVVVESTYGTRQHDDRGAVDRFTAAVNATLDRRGVVVIPAFAVDRTEIVLHLLAQVMKHRRPAPVYVDSPMALRALRVYRSAIDAGGDDLRPEVTADEIATEPPRVFETRTVKESKALNDVSGPAVIISASGMATGGRVLHHLLHRLPHEENAVVLVGFQAEGTRGRRLLDGERRVRMLGQWVGVGAEIVDCTDLSVHADRSELLAWLQSATPPQQVFVVHGEQESAVSFAETVAARHGTPASAPELGTRVSLLP